mgnify:FL=1
MQQDDKIVKKIKISNKIYPLLGGLSDDLMFWAAINTIFLTIVKGYTASQISMLVAIATFSSIILERAIFKIIKKIGNLKSFRVGLIMFLLAAIIITFVRNIFVVAIGFIIYYLAYYFTNMGNVILKRNLKAVDCENDFAKMESKTSLVYAIVTMINSFIVGFLFNINNYLPMIICILICIFNIYLSKYLYEYKDENKDIGEKIENNSKVKWTKIIILVILVYGFLYATVESLQENGKIFIQYRMQNFMPLANTSIYLSIIIAFSRIARVLSNIFFYKIHQALKTKLIILLNLLLISSVGFLILGYAVSYNSMGIIIMGIGFFILLFIRDPIAIFTKLELFNNCMMKDQEEVIHKYNLFRKIVRCFLATSASLLLLKINMLYLMMILFILCLMYLCLTVNLFKKLQ